MERLELTRQAARTAMEHEIREQATARYLQAVPVSRRAPVGPMWLQTKLFNTCVDATFTNPARGGLIENELTVCVYSHLGTRELVRPAGATWLDGVIDAWSTATDPASGLAVYDSLQFSRGSACMLENGTVATRTGRLSFGCDQSAKAQLERTGAAAMITAAAYTSRCELSARLAVAEFCEFPLTSLMAVGVAESSPLPTPSSTQSPSASAVPTTKLGSTGGGLTSVLSTLSPANAVVAGVLIPLFLTALCIGAIFWAFRRHTARLEAKYETLPPRGKGGPKRIRISNGGKAAAIADADSDDEEGGDEASTIASENVARLAYYKSGPRPAVASVGGLGSGGAMRNPLVAAEGGIIRNPLTGVRAGNMPARASAAAASPVGVSIASDDDSIGGSDNSGSETMPVALRKSAASASNNGSSNSNSTVSPLHAHLARNRVGSSQPEPLVKARTRPPAVAAANASNGIAASGPVVNPLMGLTSAAARKRTLSGSNNAVGDRSNEPRATGDSSGGGGVTSVNNALASLVQGIGDAARRLSTDTASSGFSSGGSSVVSSVTVGSNIHAKASALAGYRSSVISSAAASDRAARPSNVPPLALDALTSVGNNNPLQQTMEGVGASGARRKGSNSSAGSGGYSNVSPLRAAAMGRRLPVQLEVEVDGAVAMDGAPRANPLALAGVRATSPSLLLSSDDDDDGIAGGRARAALSRIARPGANGGLDRARSAPRHVQGGSRKA